mgnify:CR=1 FL=1
MLCDQVVFEQGSQKPYLLGIFTGLAVDGFPTPPQRFDILAALTDGLGNVTIRLTVTHLEKDEEIYDQRLIVTFPDPLQLVNVRFRIRRLVFDRPGIHLFTLVADGFGGEEIAARRIRVYEPGAGELP